MVIGNISILLKDQARCGHGRSSRRNDDEDRHIREKDGRRIKDDATKMQTDTELGKVQKELVEKEQAADSSLLSSPTRFSHQTSSRVSWDGTLVSLMGLLGRAP